MTTKLQNLPQQPGKKGSVLPQVLLVGIHQLIDETRQAIAAFISRITMRTANSLKNWLIFLTLSSFGCCAFAFPAPNHVRASTDFLLTYVDPPSGVEPNKFRSRVKDILGFLDGFEDGVEHCIFMHETVKGCNAATNGINYWPESPGNKIETVTVVNGVITITPALLPDQGFKPSDTIIAKPQYIDNNVQWDYSGGLFNIKDINKSVVDAPADYCPDPGVLPNKITNNASYIDPSSHIKYKIFNYHGEGVNNQGYTFLQAGYKGSWRPVLDCIYRIGDIKTTLKKPNTTIELIEDLYNDMGENNKQVFVLIPENGIAKIPSEGYWRRIGKEEGVCTGKKQNANVRDCPYLLKNTTR